MSRLMKYILYSFIFIVVVTGFAYKFNRELFYIADYQVTYKMVPQEKVCIFSTCPSGLVLNAVNTGRKQQNNLRFIFKGIESNSVKVDISTSLFFAYGQLTDDWKQKQSPQVGNCQSFQRRDGIEVHCKNLIPKAHVRVLVSSQLESFDYGKTTWKLAHLRIEARGSTLEEDPVKVVYLQSLTNYYDLMRSIRAIKTVIQALLGQLIDGIIPE